MSTQRTSQPNVKKLNSFFDTTFLTVLISFAVCTSTVSAQSKLDAEMAKASTEKHNIESNAVAQYVYKTTADLGAIEQGNGQSATFVMSVPEDRRSRYSLSIILKDFGTEKAVLAGLKDELRHFTSDSTSLAMLNNYEIANNITRRNVFIIINKGVMCAVQVDRLKQLSAAEQLAYLQKLEEIKQALTASAPAAIWVYIDAQGKISWNHPTL